MRCSASISRVNFHDEKDGPLTPPAFIFQLSVNFSSLIANLFDSLSTTYHRILVLVPCSWFLFPCFMFLVSCSLFHVPGSMFLVPVFHTSLSNFVIAAQHSSIIYYLLSVICAACGASSVICAACADYFTRSMLAPSSPNLSSTLSYPLSMLSAPSMRVSPSAARAAMRRDMPALMSGLVTLAP